MYQLILMLCSSLQRIAQHFASAGAQEVIISGRNLSPLEETKSSIEATAPTCAVTAITVDVTDEASVNQLFAGLARTPDILVNNAATALSASSIANSDPSTWWANWVCRSPGRIRTTKGSR